MTSLLKKKSRMKKNKVMRTPLMKNKKKKSVQKAEAEKSELYVSDSGSSTTHYLLQYRLPKVTSTFMVPL